MKSSNDHWDHAFEEMVKSGTLVKIGNSCYCPKDNAAEEDVMEAVINHFSNELNDELYEPYGKAVVQEADLKSVIDGYLNLYADKTVAVFDEWGYSHPSKPVIVSRLRDNLSDRFSF